MKISLEHSARQRKADVVAELPGFLKWKSAPLPLISDMIFPENSVQLFKVNDCNCFVKGLLAMWRIFFSLYWDSKHPNEPLPPFFEKAHKMDTLKIFYNHIWAHEAIIITCEPCREVIERLFKILASHFLPYRHLFIWDLHQIQIVIFVNSSNAVWCANSVPKSLEFATLIPFSLLSIIYSGNRSVICALQDIEDSDLCLLKSSPAMKQLCDVIGGGLLDGEFSIALHSTGHRPNKLLFHRAKDFFDKSQPNGVVRLASLGWGEGSDPPGPSLKFFRRHPQYTRAARPRKCRHRRRQMPAKPNCQVQSRSLTVPATGHLAVDLNLRIQSPLSTPASSSQFRRRLRRSRGRALKPPRATDFVSPAARQAPRCAAADVRQQVSRQKPTPRAVKTQTAARRAPSAVRERRLRRRFSTGGEDFVGERALDQLIADLQQLSTG